MVPRDIRLTIAYLVAGFLGAFILIILSNGWSNGITAISATPALYFGTALFWPLVLFWATLGDNSFVIFFTVFTSYLVPGGLTYLLLSLRYNRPVTQGHCPTCDYDLRGTPEMNDPGFKRCPECGTLVFAQPTTPSQKSNS